MLVAIWKMIKISNQSSLIMLWISDRRRQIREACIFYADGRVHHDISTNLRDSVRERNRLVLFIEP